MRKLLLFITFFSFLTSFSQEEDAVMVYDDPKYREDQFYIALTYDLLNGKPDGMSQQGLSSGYHIGMIRDLPINVKRNVGFGVGLGYSHHSYNHNLYIKKVNGVTNYQLLDSDNVSFSKNKMNIHAIELPIQFRWRTSTIESHKFWRVYTGVKLSYIFYSVSKHKGELGDFREGNLTDLNDFQTKADIGFGYNTWNFYLSYGLNNLFSDATKLNGVAINIRPVNFGLVFYIF